MTEPTTQQRAYVHNEVMRGRIAAANDALRPLDVTVLPRYVRDDDVVALAPRCQVHIEDVERLVRALDDCAARVAQAEEQRTSCAAEVERLRALLGEALFGPVPDDWEERALAEVRS